MAFWQEISLDWIAGKPMPVPEHSAGGFPSDNSETWEQVRERFLSGTLVAATIASDPERQAAIITCPTIGNPERTMSIQDQLISLAAHNSYHLGRVVLLRQLLNIWPPPDGGYSW